ncbi:membrane-associated protein, putative [Bodo saltans]|uniref:Membrane-associated protein, putative n=1 Tax=Bodo saltans TaxID=75058 RepID=A0A0S4ISM1_BODSA|nr:membrane-associated protein, putative [Bodo saltans]|eukprot:CUG06096.1 membrane-associated protein, putative [Bodo saltans]
MRYVAPIGLIVLTALLVSFRFVTLPRLSSAIRPTSDLIAQQREEGGGDGGGSKQLTGEIDHRNLISNFDRTMLCAPHGRLLDDECITISESSLPTASPACASTSIEPSSQTAKEMRSGVPCGHNESRQPDHAARCLLKFWRSKGAVCSQRPLTEATPQTMHLCPCDVKRIVAVSLVTIVATLSLCSGCVSIHTIIAVTRNPPEDGVHTVNRNNSRGSNVSDPFYLIDLVSSHFVFNTCWKGERPTLTSLAPTLTQMMSHLINDVTSSGRRSKESLRQRSHRPWSCSVLREHRLARGGNHDLELGEAAPPVYYALDVSAGIAGHALESILNGIGQYVVEGLRERQVPWLIPCSDEWENRSPDARAPLIWTEFFLELNDALQFPFYPVDFHKHFDVDSPSFVPLVFSTVHFASTQFGMNTLCLKKTLQSLLWPHSVRLEGERNWTVSSEGRFEVLYSHLHPVVTSSKATEMDLGNAVSQNDSKASHRSSDSQELSSQSMPKLTRSPTATSTSPPRRWQSNRRIAILKMLSKPSRNQNSSASPIFTSPHRSYQYSVRFERRLLERGILPLSPTLPLFERMWHVNTAELIVTTWGSTSTTIINLLFERQQQHNGSDDSGDNGARRLSEAPPQRPLRMLVLVHPLYCHEAIRVFRTTKKFLCNPRLSVKSSSQLVSVIHKHEVSRNAGDLVDHFGGQDFCVLYVLAYSLKLVGSRELDFSC